MKSIFITATDTGIGKTYITCGIAKTLRKQGINVGVMKPVCTGPRDDVKQLIRASGVGDPVDEVNPIWLSRPLAPYIASRLGKAKISIERIEESYDKLRRRHEVLLVEGIGGLMVPIKKDLNVSDLIKLFNLQAIIVARPTLGTLNHTMLTINEARRRGIKIKGVVINYCQNFPRSAAEQTNPKTIEDLTGIRVLAEIPFLRNGFSSKHLNLLVEKLL